MGAPYRAAFEAMAPVLPGYATLRRRAWESLSFPDGRDEAWRFTSVGALLRTEHPPSRGKVDLHGAAPLTEAPPHASERLGRVAEGGGFVALNTAFFVDGAWVHAPAGATRSARVGLGGTAGLTTPRVLVWAEEGAELELVVEHALGSGLHVPVIEIVAEARARVGLTQIVDGSSGHGVVPVVVDAGAEARVQLRSFVFGGDLVRIELGGGGAEGSALGATGLVLARGRRHVDHHVRFRHRSHRMRSEQQFRHVLEGRSRAVFTGEVIVERGIRGSEAHQQAQTLLLDAGARVVVRPWLQIDNDDVVASHGATVGQLDEDALFYLRQRGLERGAAERLLVRAFASALVESVPEQGRGPVQERVERWLEER